MNDTPSDSHRAGLVMDLVAEALERAPAERADYLRDACGGDEPLRMEVQSLLDQEAGAERLLSAPVFASTSGRIFGGEPGELQSGDTLGECRVIRFLGEGGTGEVYLARDTRLERDVAVKLLKRQFDEGQILRRFHHERRILAALTHPGIARLYGGATTPEGRSYLVMEYIEGERLDRYCDKNGLDVSERLAIFRKVCAAVAYAHQNLIVHRDLKPANIRVTAEGDPKLLDFGIAKLLETESSESEANPTLTIQAMMTPEYASPEQLRGEPITTASDVYSLGVVLYELLAGRRPYTLTSRRPDELARVICEQEPTRPSTVAARSAPTKSENVLRVETPARLRRRLEGDLDNIVAMALRKEPVRRYSSVAQFSEDLRRHVEGLPVIARRDTLGYRVGKFVRRNKTGAVAAVLVVLALVGGLVATSWQSHVAQQERDHARQERDRAQIAQKQAQKINGFLENLLTSADPFKQGKDVKVVEVLDNAGKSLDLDLADEPEVLAQLHATLATAYSRLAAFVQAEQHARAAWTILRGLYGDEDFRAAREENELARILGRRKLSDQAEPLFRHALAVERRQNPPDIYHLAYTLDGLSLAVVSNGRPREAEPILQEATALMREARGENSKEYISTLTTLSTLKRAERDLDGAVAAYRQIIALYDRISPGSADSVSTQGNLCIILIRQRKMAEAEVALNRQESDCHRLFGENNQQHGFTLELRSLFDFARGDYAKAIPEIRHAIEIISVLYPREDNEDRVQMNGLLGVCLTRTGRPEAAEPLLRKALVDGKNVDITRFDRTYGNLPTALGECLFAQKRYAEAEPLLLTGYADLEHRLGEHDMMTASAAERLHAFYSDWNKPVEAARFASSGAGTAAK